MRLRDDAVETGPGDPDGEGEQTANRSRQPTGRALIVIVVIVAIVAIVALVVAPVAHGGQTLIVRTEIRRLLDPIAIDRAADGSGRLFVAQRNGLILVRQPGAKRSRVFLDLTRVIGCCADESGLLGMAFHPAYRDNGFFFVNYTDPEGDSMVARYSVSTDPNRADPDSAGELLRIQQPSPFHNSAHLAFGPDGYLYIGVGDGSSDGDKADNAQNLGSLLGKILRLDVDGAWPYEIPADNPFIGVTDALPEIWAYGLRNPWRFSFDSETGDLYLGDVGQNSFEEIDFQPRESTGGENYGWRRKEGDACFEPPSSCGEDGLSDPIFSYPHSTDPETRCSGSVTGGIRYRGPQAATLSGLYLFADFCSGEIWGGRRNGAGNWLFRPLLESELRITSFAEDERGRLLVAALGGRVYKLRGRALFSSDFSDPRLRDWSRRKGRPQVRRGGPGDDEGRLRLPLDGTSRRVFVRSLAPQAEPFLRVAFDLRVGHSRPGEARIEILRLMGETPLASLSIEQDADGYAARLVARENDGGSRLVGTVDLPGAATTRLEVEWMRATDEQADDGEIVLYKNGREHARRGNLATAGQAVDSVLLGLPSGAAGTLGGALLIGRYRSSR